MKYGEQNLNLAGEMARSHWLAADEKNNSFFTRDFAHFASGDSRGFLGGRQLIFLHFMVKNHFSTFHSDF